MASYSKATDRTRGPKPPSGVNQVLAQPKQSGQIGCDLAQIARLAQIGIGNLTFEHFGRLGPTWHKNTKGKLARLVIPRLEIILSHWPDWLELQIGAGLDLPDWCQIALAWPEIIIYRHGVGMPSVGLGGPNICLTYWPVLNLRKP